VEYSTCIHEAGHGVVASLLGIEFLAVTTYPEVDGPGLGRMIEDLGDRMALLSNPYEQAAAEDHVVCCLAGPVAQARWESGEYAERIHIGRLEDFGGSQDLDIARAIAEGHDLKLQSLLADAIGFVHTDRVWLAIQRAADALSERRVLLSTDVDKLVGKKARGAGEW
jgi:hypothetical protein